MLGKTGSEILRAPCAQSRCTDLLLKFLSMNTSRPRRAVCKGLHRYCSVKSAQLYAGKVFQLSVAIADPLFRHAHPVQDGQKQIRHRGLLGIPEMASTFDLARCAPGQQDWQILV